MSAPLTEGECYARLHEWLVKAQEEAAMMAHLVNAQHKTGQALATGWLKISENLRMMQMVVQTLAARKMQ